MPPKLLSKNNNNNERAGGVLPVNAAARAAASKAPAARLKLEIRRLPPGLTLAEFEQAIGEEWKLGCGKVDWREYRQGKAKTSAGKVPEQSRCYVHLANESLVKEFEAAFLATTFLDKAGSHKNPELRYLPPTLGFAPNQRTPLNAKVRADNRQGTIDQDPEFIAFLEAETQPIVKAPALDSSTVEKEKAEKIEIKSTPLIEALREKKANKAKAAASKKEEKEAKGHARGAGKETATGEKDKKDAKAAPQKSDSEPKAQVKVLNKPTAGKQPQQQSQQKEESSQQSANAKNATPAKSKKAASNVKTQNSNSTAANNTTPAASSPATATQGPAQQRAARQRGNTDGIKKMLQKDLGIRPKASAPAATQSAASSPAGTDKASTNSPAVPSGTANPSSKKQQNAVNAATSTAPAATPSKQQSTSKQQSALAQTANQLKAYLKHANPSQGMTEILIQQALGQFGDVASVTIDPRKGTAIAIFKDAETLKKAIEAKKVPVAKGTIEVLEFKDRAAAPGAGTGSSGGGGGGGGGRGGYRGRGGKGHRGNGQGASQNAPSATLAAPAAGATPAKSSAA